MKFRDKVLAIVRKIPKGKSMTYKEVARKAGNAKAARAVGAIMRTNYDPAIPCHRVIGADGSLTGYGGGTATKGWLLRHERAVLASRGSSSSQTQFWASPSDSPPLVPRRRSVDQSS